MTCTLRKLNRGDLDHWPEYDLPECEVLEGLTAERDGVVVGAAGIYQDSGMNVMFFRIKDALRADKRSLVKFIPEAMAMAARYKFVVALQDENEPTSRGFLKHLGFTHVGTTPEGEIHIWQS